MYRLPPLNPLRTFVVAARHDSFSQAAEAMNVTQAAVSRQIAVLEAFLGVELFHRTKRAADLTAVGRHYAASIQKSFEIIASATDDAMFETASHTLNIRAYTTFATLWLVPRLQKFRELYPDLNLNLTTSVLPVDFDHENVDVAVQIGTPMNTGVRFDPLFPVMLRPVCSPDYLARGTHPKRPEDLMNATILQSIHRRGDWRAWLKKAGTKGVNLHECLLFESSGLAYRAAVEGLGVAMGHGYLMTRDLREGRLVTPFDVTLYRRYSYCLVYKDSSKPPKKVSRFRDWIQSEAAESVALDG